MSMFDPRDVDTATRPGGMRFARFGGRNRAQVQAQRFASYSNAGYDHDEAAMLAADPMLDPMHVRRVTEHQRTVRLGAQFAELEPAEMAKRWQDLSDEDRQRLRDLDDAFGSLDPPEQSGFFSIPVIGAAAKKGLQAGTWVAEGINTATFGAAGKALGGALEGAEWLQNKVNRRYRQIEWNVRRHGFLTGWFKGGTPFDPDDGENSFRPGTMAELTERAGDQDLADMARMIARGWTNEQILTYQGFEHGSTAYGKENDALYDLRENERVKDLVHFLERQKMSPGRALAGALGVDGSAYTWLSGITDGLWAITADPTLAFGKGAKAARIARHVRIDDAAQWANRVDEVLGSAQDLARARTLRQADGVINPLDHGSYFAGLRRLRAEGYTAEQVDAVMFMDHMLAGTKAGGTGAVGDDGVAAVLGQYQRLRPDRAGLVYGMQAKINAGEVNDALSMAAAMRDGVLLEAMRAGVGRAKVLDRVPGMFVPRLTRAGQARLRTRLALDEVIDWSRAQPFALKAGQRLAAADLADAQTFLSETMRTARGEAQTTLDDYVDWAGAMRRQGFDADTISEVVQRSMVDELGGLVIDGEAPVYALARLAVREGRVDEDGVRAIHRALTNLYPDDPEVGARLVAAFDDAADRYFARFRDGRAPSYAETLLDDAELDGNVQRLVVDLDDAYARYLDDVASRNELAERAAEARGTEPDLLEAVTKTRFLDQAFDRGLWQRLADDDPIEHALSRVRDRWGSASFEMRSPTGGRAPISDPDEYRDLVADITRGVLDTRLADEAVGADLLLNAKIGLLPRVTRAVVKPFAALARQMPRHNYIAFDDPTGESINELRRFLDLGVFGDDANRLLGEFITAASDAQRRDVLFAAQRELLRHTGILYDPAHTEWVRDVLARTHQFAGGTWVDNTAQLRPMALFPQAQRARALRLIDARDVMAHFQRTRFMALMSPRFGSFLAKDGATYVQRVNRYWKPAAVLSPRLILRAGLDELLTLVGAEGAANVQRRYVREWVIRYQQRRFTRAMALSKVDPKTLVAEGFETIPGRVPMTVDDVYAKIDDVLANSEAAKRLEFATAAGVPTAAERAAPGTVQAAKRARAGEAALAQVTREMVRDGLLAPGRNLTDLPARELDDLLAQAKASQLLTARRPILEKWAPHLTESARLTERLADGIVERIAAHVDLNEGHLRAAMAMAIDPVVQRSLTQEITHAGSWWQARELLDPTDPVARSADIEELGILRLVGDKGEYLAGDATDLLGRQGLFFQMDLAQSDDFVRDVVTPLVRMELDDDVRLALSDTLARELDFIAPPAATTLGDPFADDVVDGIFAPAVERAARDGDRILQARLTWLALPDDQRAGLLDELALAGTFRPDHDAYRAHLASLGVDESSSLYLDPEAYDRFTRWLAQPGTDTEKRWQVAVTDDAIRPGAPLDALSVNRIGDDGTFYLDTGLGTRGPGGTTRIRPQKVARTEPVRGRTATRLDAEGRYALSLDAPTPPTLARALNDNNARLLDRLGELFDDPADRDAIQAMFYLDATVDGAVDDFVTQLDDRVAAIAQGWGDDGVDMAVRDLLTDHFWEPLHAKGFSGFTRGNIPTRNLDDAAREGDVFVFPHKQASLFVEPTQARYTAKAAAEVGLRDRYDTQVDDWLDLLQGRPAQGNRLARQRQVEYLTRTDYWDDFRAHDLVGTGNDVRQVIDPDRVILHVPRRKGEALAADTYGSIDPALADEYLDLVAGGAKDDWEIVEVPLARDALAARRASAEASTRELAAGLPAADIPPSAARFGDQLYRLRDEDLAFARLRPEGTEPVVHLGARDPLPEDWPDQVRALADDDPRAAAELVLRAAVDEAGAALTPDLVADRTGALLRTHGWAAARRRGIDRATINRLADFQADTGWAPGWAAFDESRTAAQVQWGKRLDTAAHDFVAELDRNLRSMFFDSHHNRPMWDLLGPVERNALDVAHMDRYHGALPAQVIRPKMKPIDDKVWFWRGTDRFFEWISHGIAELARYPMFVDNFAVGLDDARAARQATSRHLAREETFRGIFGDRFDELMLRFENEFAAVIGASDRANLLVELDDELIANFAQFYGDLPASQLDEFRRFLGAEMSYRERERRDAMIRAIRETTPYIDDHKIRSQFADAVDEVIPFFYATEHFVRRWARTAYTSPEAFRRLQLYYHGAEAYGIVTTDPATGEAMIEYPLTGFLMDTVANIFGNPGDLVPGVNFRGRAIDVIPGLQDPLRFGAGPAIMAPLSMLRPFGPEEVDSLERFLGGERSVGRPAWQTLLPYTVQRFGAAFTGNDRDTIAMLAYMSANHPELIPGNRLDEDGEPVPATMDEWQDFLDRMHNGSRVVGLFRGLFGLGVPASPRIDFDVDGLQPELVDLLDSGLPMEQAVGEFLRRHPHATPYTVFGSTSYSGSPVNPVASVFEHLDTHRDWYEDNRLAGSWLLPYDDEGEFDGAAWAEMVSMQMRERKDPEEWWKDLKFAQGAQLYFPAQDAKDRAMATATNPQARAVIAQQWRLWLADFQTRHPMFVAQLASQEGVSRRRDVRREMRLALSDPERPEGLPQVESIGALLAGWDQLSLMLNDHVSYSVEHRKEAQAQYHVWAWEITERDPMARAFYQRNLQPDLPDLPPAAEAFTARLGEVTQ